MSRTRQLTLRFAGLSLALAGLLFSFQNCAKGLPDDVADQASTVTLNGESAERAGLSCKSILDAGLSRGSGPYWVDVDGAGELAPVEAYCEMDLEGGGWTLIAANSATTTFTNFNKPWADYRAGFGSVATLSGSGWIGLERMYQMTRSPRELKVATNVQSHYYVNFSLGNEAQNYTLLVTGTATSFDGGLFASYHGGTPFSTADRDNDSNTTNCASVYATGWWHAACYQMSIGGNNTGVVYWRNTAGAVENATSIHMWVR